MEGKVRVENKPVNKKTKMERVMGVEMEKNRGTGLPTHRLGVEIDRHGGRCPGVSLWG